MIGDLFATSSALHGSCWRFAYGDGTLIAPVVVLLPDGLLGGYSHKNERSWKLTDGALALLDMDGRTTAIFGQTSGEVGDGLSLTGCHTFSPHKTLILQQLERLPQALPERGAKPASFLHANAGSGRRNLVVINANEKSLHKDWLQDIPTKDRSWDMCQCFYGPDPSLAAAPFEYIAHTPYAGKFRTIYDVFPNESPLWAYDHIWLPDDDIATSWSAVNQMFEICRRYNLRLSQPALTPNSYISHPILQVQEELGLRFTNFVEIMCPVFSREALRICMGTFRNALSGYKLDMIWPKLLGDIPGRVAVIDAVAVTHTRPVGATYDTAAATAEGLRLAQLYRLEFQMACYGGFPRRFVVP